MKQTTIDRLHTLSTLVSRMQLAYQMGIQYQGDRNIYRALGYPTRITYVDYLSKYIRQDIATAIIDKPVDATWQGGVTIQEPGQEDTPLQVAWKRLCKNRNLQVIPTLSRFDKLIGLGEYAILLLGFSDVQGHTDFQKPVSKNVDLLYLRPLGQGSIDIMSWDTDTTSPRYGLPVMYQIELYNAANDVSQTLLVHYTRVIHAAENVLEGTVKGRSRLQPVYNRLMDLEKIVGGSAEMFWRGARPGYKGKLDEGFSLTDEEEEELEHQLDEYENNLRRFFVSKGIDISAMEMQVADPKNHVEVQLEMISAQTGIPKRILVGSERGELASSQDMEAWYSSIDKRRTGFVEHEILRPFVDKCIEVGVLPPPTGEKQSYVFVWRPLFEQSEQDKATVGEIRAKALNQYAAQPMAENIVPPEAFYKYFLGLSEDQIEDIKQMQETAMMGEE